MTLRCIIQPLKPPVRPLELPNPPRAKLDPDLLAELFPELLLEPTREPNDDVFTRAASEAIGFEDDTSAGADCGHQVPPR
jgi:hypothetical protein